MVKHISGVSIVGASARLIVVLGRGKIVCRELGHEVPVVPPKTRPTAVSQFQSVALSVENTVVTVPGASDSAGTTVDWAMGPLA
jgi:hypothetical protein